MSHVYWAMYSSLNNVAGSNEMSLNSLILLTCGLASESLHLFFFFLCCSHLPAFEASFSFTPELNWIGLSTFTLRLSCMVVIL